MSMEDRLQETQERVEEAKNLVKLGEAYAGAASGMQNVGGHAEDAFDEVAETAYEAGDRNAERAIDAFKDAYLEAFLARTATVGLKGFDEIQTQLQGDELGEQILEGTELEDSEVSRKEIYRVQNRAERIMQQLQDQYGEALDFQGYVDRVLAGD